MTTWNDIRLPAREDRLWEVYHENSKMSRVFENRIWRKEDLEETLQSLHHSLPVQSTWSADLGIDVSAFKKSLTDILEKEHKQRGGLPVTFDQLRTVLGMSVKLIKNTTSGISAFYPLEIFGYTPGIDTGPSGLFHVNWMSGRIEIVNPNVSVEKLNACFDHPAARSYIFITAIFQKSAMVYSEKGYRYAVAESGRFAQNILISATAAGVPAKLESQFYEREIENLIGVDGVDHALLQAIGF